MKNIKESNKLIAEFIGMQKTSIGWYDSEEVLLTINNNTFDTLYFHKSWDWLMPIVEQCVSLDEVYEMNNYEQYNNNIQDALWTINIDEVYTAVVKFIKWYNNEKEN